jgi:hypothetical protein
VSALGKRGMAAAENIMGVSSNCFLNEVSEPLKRGASGNRRLELFLWQALLAQDFGDHIRQHNSSDLNDSFP